MVKNLSVADIMCAVYNKTITSEGVVHKWIHMFKNGKANIHDKEMSDCMFVQSHL